MANDNYDQRFLRFARAIALVSGVALPLGTALPACADTTAPPVADSGTDLGPSFPDAGISVQDTGGTGVDVAPVFLDAGASADPDAGDGAAPTDATGADAASDAPTFEVTGGPLMPPEFDEALA